MEAGKLKQEERDKIRIYITKFKEFRLFFKSSLLDKVIIRMFLQGTKQAVKSHSIRIRGMKLSWEHFITEAQEIDNQEYRDAEVRPLK